MIQKSIPDIQSGYDAIATNMRAVSMMSCGISRGIGNCSIALLRASGIGGWRATWDADRDKLRDTCRGDGFKSAGWIFPRECSSGRDS